MKKDLTQHSDGELSLLVFNDEYLYCLRHDDRLFPAINELYTYSRAQMMELLKDLEGDL